MGADLIAYTVVGPKSLNEDLRDEACKLIAKKRKALLENWEDEKEDYGDCQDDWWSELDDMPPEGQMDDCLYGDASRIVDDLFDVWKNGARDSCSRRDPEDATKKIVIAGERSWGGYPSGFGYKTLDKANFLGLFELFNIK